MAAVGLEEWLGAPPAFCAGFIGGARLQRIFRECGAPFDVRLGLQDAPEILLSEPGVFEDVQFMEPEHPATQLSLLTITRAGRMDGLLLFIQLYCDPLSAPIDSYHQMTSWRPIFIPIFETAQQVEAGDELQVLVQRRLSDNGIHPDYHISAALARGERAVTSSRFLSSHHGPAYKQNAFYAGLFQSGASPKR
jgi:protein arginine N-methyltransferase 1